MNPSLRLRATRVAVVCVLLVGMASCTENDEHLLEEIGVTRLYLIDPAVRTQSIVSPDNRIQVVEWELDGATLDIDGALLDLVSAGDSCSFTQTAFVSSVAEGMCALGIVIESSDQPFEITLRLSIQAMTVRRGVPHDPTFLDLSLTHDFDGDGQPNDANRSGSSFDVPCGQTGAPAACDDNCPLIANADQADVNADGVGNACSVFDPFFGPLRDSDGDAVYDGNDNCVWISNPDQADTSGPPVGSVTIRDAIGDACDEESAIVRLNGASSFELILPATELLQAFQSNTYVTVDFNNFAALDCNWEALACELDPDAVQLCAHTSIVAARGGC